MESNFEHLQQTYLLRRYNDLGMLNNWIKNLNYSAISQFSHKLIGNARMYEFVGLEKIAQDMKNSSNEKNLAKLEKSISNFILFLQKNWIQK